MDETVPSPITVTTAATTRALPAARPLDLSGARSRQTSERIIGVILLACGVLSIFTTVGIVAVLLIQALEFFRAIPVGEFLTGTFWRPANESYGVLSLVSGTLTVSFFAMLIAIPFGLGAAIYLSEYAPQSVRTFLKPILELIASVPTIVFGFWALTFITPSVLRRISTDFGTFNLMAASIAVGILIIPLIASLSEDAMRAVPRSLREGAYALGATKFETSVRVVVPAALSGIVASIILALSRAVGEVMIVVLAAGSRPPAIPASIYEQSQTMTSYMVNELQADVARGSTRYYALFAVGLALFVITLTLNIISRAVVAKFREVYQ